MHDGQQEGLLAVGAVEVPVLQAMALSHEGQRLRGVEHLTPGGEVGAGEVVVHGVVQTHLDAAEALGEVVEPARFTSAK